MIENKMLFDCVDYFGEEAEDNITEVVSDVCASLAIGNDDFVGSSMIIKANDLQFAVALMTNFWNNCYIVFLVEYFGMAENNQFILLRVTFHRRGTLKMIK